MGVSPEIKVEGGKIELHPCAIDGAPPGMGAPLHIDPRRSAVVVVDMQRYFVDTPPFTAMQELREPIARVLTAARAAGITVVHLITELSPGSDDAGRPGSRTRQMMNGIGDGLVRGSRGAEIVAELSPAPADIVVVKTRFSGFWASRLDQVLKERNIGTLIMAGGTTTVCVESTVRDALFLEYNALVLSDCTRDISPELHESALARIEMFFGWVCESDALLPALASLGEPVR